MTSLLVFVLLLAWLIVAVLLALWLGAAIMLGERDTGSDVSRRELLDRFNDGERRA